MAGSNPAGRPLFSPMKVRLVVILLVTLVATALRASGATAAAATLTGTVSNVATGNLLEGAQVAIPALGVSTFTDNTGLYSLHALPAGTHELVVSYTGLDPARATVTVAPDA